MSFDEPNESDNEARNFLENVSRYLAEQRRAKKLIRKLMIRWLVGLVSILGIFGGLISILILSILSSIRNMIILSSDFINLGATSPITDLFKGFGLFTLDDRYMTWLIPFGMFLLGWLGYRLTKDRNEKDIVIECFESFLPILGFGKKTK